MFKKIVFGLVFIITFFLLMGCSSGKVEYRNLRTEINELIDMYPDKRSELELLRDELFANPSQVYTIAKRIQTLKPIYKGIYDGFLIVKIIDLTNEVIKDEEVLFRQNESLWDVLIRNFDIAFEEDENKQVVKSIGGSFIDSNYRLSFYLNGNFIADFKNVSYSYGDTLTIRNENQSSFDHVELMIDQVIYRFIRNRLNGYFTKAPIMDPYIVNAIKMLEVNGYNISLTAVASKIKYEEFYQKKIYDVNDKTYINHLLKDILIMQAFELDTAHLLVRLNGVKNSFSDVQKFNALLSFGKARSDLQSVSSLLAFIDRYIPTEKDADNVSLALMALANYPDYNNYNQNVKRYSEYLAQKMTPSGIGATGANSISTSNAIIALISVNKNPRSKLYEANGIDLIEALLKYERDAAFSWTENSGLDLVFSTPQAFASLVTYKVYRDQLFNSCRLF